MKHVGIADIQPGFVALLGVPWDEQSSFLRGAARGPQQVRAALASPSSNMSTESGRDLGAETGFVDAGDCAVPEGAAAVTAIEQRATDVLRAGASLLSLGGDHAVTYPLLRAHHAVRGPISIVHVDAHPDLYDEFEGNRLSHACPFARILEEGLATRLVQVGIRTMTPHQRAQAARFGVEVVEMRQWSPALEFHVNGPFYLSLDLDALDPAFAPGVSHHEPGGLTVRDVITLVHRVRGSLVGADIVELNPARDPSGITAMVAAKFVKEIADRLLGQGSERA